MVISNGSKKRCRIKFDYTGVNKIINRCAGLLEDFGPEVVMAEFIYDHDDALTYNVFLFLLLENVKEEKLINELRRFKFISNKNKINVSVKRNSY